MVLNNIGKQIYNVVKLAVCIFGLTTTFYMVIDLTYFLSVPKVVKFEPSTRETWVLTSWALLSNMFLLSLFILQHSVLASSIIKEAFNTYGLQPIYRSLYVITTSGILLYLIRHWSKTPLILWEINFNYRPILWIHSLVHFISWLTIYVGNICTDVTELLGIKQIYYSILNLPDPNSRKSTQLQRLTDHMRHPSFIAFILIFWMYPIMSLDRLLLATILTSYMYLAWNTDEGDYYYHKYQYQRKHFELENLNKRYSY